MAKAKFSVKQLDSFTFNWVVVVIPGVLLTTQPLL